MSENLWRPRLESYLAVREAMGHSVRAERKLLGEFLDFVDQKGGAGPIRAEWALDWACMLSPRRGVGGQAGRLSVVRNFLTYLRAFIAETEVPHHGLLSGPNRRKPYLFSADEIRRMLAATMELGPRNSFRPHTYNALLGLLASTGLRVGEAIRLTVADVQLTATPPHLIIRETKFAKSRLVPLLSSSRAASTSTPIPEWRRTTSRIGSSRTRWPRRTAGRRRSSRSTIRGPGRRRRPIARSSRESTSSDG